MSISPSIRRASPQANSCDDNCYGDLIEQRTKIMSHATNDFSRTDGSFLPEALHLSSTADPLSVRATNLKFNRKIEQISESALSLEWIGHSIQITRQALEEILKSSIKLNFSSTIDSNQAAFIEAIRAHIKRLSDAEVALGAYIATAAAVEGATAERERLLHERDRELRLRAAHLDFWEAQLTESLRRGDAAPTPVRSDAAVQVDPHHAPGPLSPPPTAFTSHSPDSVGRDRDHAGSLSAPGHSPRLGPPGPVSNSPASAPPPVATRVSPPAVAARGSGREGARHSGAANQPPASPSRASPPGGGSSSARPDIGPREGKGRDWLSGGWESSDEADDRAAGCNRDAVDTGRHPSRGDPAAGSATRSRDGKGSAAQPVPDTTEQRSETRPPAAREFVGPTDAGKGDAWADDWRPVASPEWHMRWERALRAAAASAGGYKLQVETGKRERPAARDAASSEPAGGGGGGDGGSESGVNGKSPAELAAEEELAGLAQLAGVAERYGDALVDRAAGVRRRAEAVAAREAAVAAREAAAAAREAELRALAAAAEEYARAIAAQDRSLTASADAGARREQAREEKLHSSPSTE